MKFCPRDWICIWKISPNNETHQVAETTMPGRKMLKALYFFRSPWERKRKLKKIKNLPFIIWSLFTTLIEWVVHYNQISFSVSRLYTESTLNAYYGRWRITSWLSLLDSSVLMFVMFHRRGIILFHFSYPICKFLKKNQPLKMWTLYLLNNW